MTDKLVEKCKHGKKPLVINCIKCFEGFLEEVRKKAKKQVFDEIEKTLDIQVHGFLHKDDVQQLKKRLLNEK